MKATIRTPHTDTRRLSSLIATALLAFSVAVGAGSATPAVVERKHTFCVQINDPNDYYALTGVKSDLGGFWCWKW